MSESDWVKPREPMPPLPPPDPSPKAMRLAGAIAQLISLSHEPTAPLDVRAWALDEVATAIDALDD